jgi:hypothetical protein
VERAGNWVRTHWSTGELAKNETLPHKRDSEP